MKRVLRSLAVVALCLLLLLFLGVIPWSLMIPFTLLLGWIPSGARLLKAWHPTGAGTALFGLALLVLTVGSHLFLRWLKQSTQSDHAAGSGSCWRWKWTLCGLGIFFCTLLAVCSMVLTTHQLYWMSRSGAPWLTDISTRAYAVRAAHDLQQLAEEMQWDTRNTRTAFWTKGIASRGNPAAEEFQPVWIEADEQRLRAIVLIPRQPLHRRYARAAILEPGKPVTTRSLDQVPQVLALFGIKTGSLAVKSNPTLLP